MSELHVTIGLTAAAVIMFLIEARAQRAKEPPPAVKPEPKKSHTIYPLDWDGDEQKWRLYIENEINSMGIVLKQGEDGAEKIDFEDG